MTANSVDVVLRNVGNDCILRIGDDTYELDAYDMDNFIQALTTIRNVPDCVIYRSLKKTKKS